MRSAIITTFLVFLQFTLFSQTLIFKGIIRDEQSLKPIPEVNIKIYGTTRGTATDNAGRFLINLENLPATLLFSCVGYENAFFKVTEVSKTPIEFLLRSKSYTLKEVSITSKNYSFLFKDKDYSVLDYELMDDKVLLLIFRTLLNKSQLILLGRNGDTLAVSTLPEVPPSRLFKDFFSNIHYFSRSDFAYQCFYNKGTKNVDFLYKTTVDSLEKAVKPYLFCLSNRLYFQESIANKFGTAIGYYEKGTGKKYIRQVIYSKKITEFIDDEMFYAKWNEFIAKAANLSLDDLNGDSRFYNADEARAHAFEYFNMIFPVIKTGDNTITFINFGDDDIELMNKDGKILKTVPISFHHETVKKSDTISSVRLSDPGWRWGTTILVDEYNRNIYTTYLRSGMIRINRIDVETGKLYSGTVIPLPFPEKIEIYNGEAYFLNKGINENWKLAKCRL